MQDAAYWTALVTVVAVPPVLLFWFIVHPFTRWWRRLGALGTYLILLPPMGGLMALIYWFRESLLALHFGVRWPFTAAAIVIFLASIVIGALHRRHLTPAVLFGLPQLSRRGRGELLTEGVYAHIRHPRYVQVGLGFAGIALFANYLALYVIAVGYWPVIFVVVLLEERELRERFGRQYEEYARRVPRFFPRLRRERPE